MRATFKRELEKRPEHALLAPPSFEDRAMDAAIDALEDIRECDEAVIYVKWDKFIGVTAPLLYILFDGNCPSLEKVPRLHLHPKTGRLHPAHAICLAKLPSGTLLSSEQIKEATRRGVEGFLRAHGVQPSSMAIPEPLQQSRLPG
jgi:hypothetical protein